MPKVVTLPNGETAGFPDDMPDDQIEKVLRKQFPPQKPVVNQDGSYSTERTVTMQDEQSGKWYNVPTLRGGVQLTDEQVRQEFNTTRRHLGEFASKDEAVLAAQRRSAEKPPQPHITPMDVLAASAPDVPDILGGLIEQIPAAIGDLGTLATQSAQSLVRAGIAKAAGYDNASGKSWMEIYLEELNDKLSKDESQSFLNTFRTLTQPQTESGRIMYDGFGQLFEVALQTIGGQIFEKGIFLPLPVLGDRILPAISKNKPDIAAGMTGAAAVVPMLPMVRSALRPPDYVNKPGIGKVAGDYSYVSPDVELAIEHPVVYQRMMASSTGRTKLGSSPVGVRAAVTNKVYNDLVALGVDAERLKGASLSDMLVMKLELVDPQNTVPAGLRRQSADFFSDVILSGLEEKEAGLRRKALPAPSPVEGPVTVNPRGVATTSVQEQALEAARRSITGSAELDRRAEVLGIGPMGQLRADRTAFYSNKAKLPETPAAAREAKIAEKNLRVRWSKAFPKARVDWREQAFKDFLGAGGDEAAGWDYWAARVYTRPKVNKQSGMVDIEGLEDLAHASIAVLHRLPSAAVLTRAQIESVVRQQDISENERALVMRVLGDQNKVDARQFAKDIGRELIPLRETRVRKYTPFAKDSGMYFYGDKLRPDLTWWNGEDGIATAGAITRGDFQTLSQQFNEGKLGRPRTAVYRGPFPLLATEDHFSIPDQVFHVRGWDQWDAKRQVPQRFTFEIQSDLLQSTDVKAELAEGRRLVDQSLAVRAIEPKLLDAIQTRRYADGASMLTSLKDKIQPETYAMLKDTLSELISTESSILIYKGGLRALPMSGSLRTGLKALNDTKNNLLVTLRNELDYLSIPPVSPRTIANTEKLLTQLTRNKWHERAIREELKRWSQETEGTGEYLIATADTMAKAEWRGQTLFRHSLEGQKVGDFLEIADPAWGDVTGYKDHTIGPLIIDRSGMYFQTSEGALFAVDEAKIQAMIESGKVQLLENSFRISPDLARRVAPIIKRYKSDIEGFVQKNYQTELYTDEFWNTWHKIDLRLNPDTAGRIPVFGAFESPGKKQRGMIDVEGLEETPKAAQAVREGAKKAAVTGYAVSDAEKVKQAFDRSRELSSTNEPFFERLRKATSNKILDHAGKVKAELLKQGGKEGENAVMFFELMQGANPRAKMIFDREVRPLLEGISRSDYVELEDVIRSRRLHQIFLYKGDGYKPPEGVTHQQVRAFMAEQMKRLGEARYDALNTIADKVFDIYQQRLLRLYDEGLITKHTYNKLALYEYTPTEFVELLDPSYVGTFAGSPISVRDSGVPYLEMHSRKGAPVRMDPKTMLAETIVRTENRIAKNRAAKALYEFAAKHPENTVARVVRSDKFKWKPDGTLENPPKVQPGYEVVYARVDGKQQPIVMHGWLAKQWTTHPQAMETLVGDLIRVGSGTALLKATTTGYNPAFLLVELPRSIMYTYLATNNLYSPHMPIFMAQIARDYASVFTDAVTRTGLYETYIQNGGGMNFLTHQGREFLPHFKDNAAIRIGAQHARKWEQAKQALSYLNETAEIWNRLAVMKRAMRSNVGPTKATWIARNMLDFAQGGVASKGLDTFLPYFNAGMQALRGVARSTKRDPADFTIKATWAIGTLASYNFAMMASDPEFWQQLSTYDKVNNLIVRVPMLDTIDSRGNKRYGYFTLRLDQTAAAVNALAVAIMEKAHFGKVPDRLTRQTIGSFVNIVPHNNLAPPSAEAIFTLAAEYDLWTDESLWKGPKSVPPELRFKSLPGQPTAEVWKQIGKLAKVNPEAAKAAFHKLVPQNNFYLDLVYQGHQRFVEGLTPYERAKTSSELLVKTPGLGRILKLTHPAARDIPEVDELAQEVAGEEKLRRDELEELIFREQTGQLPGGRQAIKDWIKQQPPDRQKAYAQRYATKVVLDQIFKDEKASVGIPGRTWWEKVNALDPEARAQVFVNRLQEAAPDERKRMLRIAQKMTAAGSGFMSERFMYHYRKEAQRADIR